MPSLQSLWESLDFFLSHTQIRDLQFVSVFSEKYLRNNNLKDYTNIEVLCICNKGNYSSLHLLLCIKLT